MKKYIEAYNLDKLVKIEINRKPTPKVKLYYQGGQEKEYPTVTFEEGIEFSKILINIWFKKEQKFAQ